MFFMHRVAFRIYIILTYQKKGAGRLQEEVQKKTHEVEEGRQLRAQLQQ